MSIVDPEFYVLDPNDETQFGRMQALAAVAMSLDAQEKRAYTPTGDFVHTICKELTYAMDARQRKERLARYIVSYATLEAVPQALDLVQQYLIQDGRDQVLPTDSMDAAEQSAIVPAVGPANEAIPESQPHLRIVDGGLADAA